MLASHGRWFDRRKPDSRWPSFVVSVVLTIAVFAVALESMRRVPRVTSAPPTDRLTAVTLQLAPPLAPPVRKPQARRGSTLSTRSPATRARADSANGRPGADATKPAGNAAPPAGGAGADAPAILGGGGFRITSETPFVVHYRDSLAKIKSDSEFRAMAMKHAPTGAEKLALEASQRTADQMAHRVGTAGAGADVHVGQGQGVDGVGAVGGGLGASIGVPLLSKGKSAEQRRKDEAIDADNKARLKRLQEIVARRDSIRADSIAKAKLRIVP